MGRHHPPAEQDPDLADKLRAEAPGILRWIVDGAQRFLTDGLHVPETVRMATDRYRADEDVVGRFIAEVLRIGDGWARAADIEAEAERWATEQGLPIPSMQEVVPVLIAAGCTRDRKTINGHKFVIWLGVNVPSTDDSTASHQEQC
jgi:hypothetical protein